MTSGRSFRGNAAIGAALIFFTAAEIRAQRPTSIVVTRESPAELRAADRLVDQMIRDRGLVATAIETDPLVNGRRHERFEQFVRGVRIAGGDVTRQTGTDGTVSLFGFLHGDVPLNLTPRLSREEAATAIARAAGGELLGRAPELVVLPLSDGYHLAYYGQATGGLEIRNVFVDANSGASLRQFSDFIREVGHGRGAYGDDKKVSARGVGGTFVTDDPLRPAPITTYDMRGNLARLTSILNRITPVAPSDISTDTDNDWTDTTVVDAHVYAGWYYDFLFKRFGRRGLDNRDLRMPMFTHPVRQQDIATASPDVVGLFYLNAFFCNTCLTDRRGAMVFGEGAPPNFFPGIEVKPFSAALDVVAHELTHGLTANSANLNGFPFSEAGALNEAFSDMLGAATAFFYQPAGTAPLNASYVTGRDLTIPPGLFSRSMADPGVDGSPDHYTKRITGADPHFNSTIASHAYYLAIEGGTNRTSGLSVTGVGAANRDQIEKAFFRALTVLLPSSATFALTRTATIQAAQDLFGAGSAAMRAITQAWDAVGVQPRTAPTATLLPNPAQGTADPCGSAAPSWDLGVTVSAGATQPPHHAVVAGAVRRLGPVGRPRNADRRRLQRVLQPVRPRQPDDPRAGRCVRRRLRRARRCQQRRGANHVHRPRRRRTGGDVRDAARAAAGAAMRRTAMMRHYAAPALLGLLIAFPAPARAQSGGWRDRGYVTIGGWYQPVGTTFSDEIQPIIDVEAADIDTEYDTGSAAGFDVGGGVRVWRNLGVGVNVSRFSKTSNGTVDAQVPHPLFFRQPRTVTGEAEALERDETAVHIRLLWMVPLRERLHLGLSGGPSWFNVGQDLVTNIAVTQTYPFDSATFASATNSRQTGTHAGFNAAADLTFILQPHVGVGMEVSFSRANVPLDTVTVDAGGLHIGGGLRFRF